MTTEEFRNSLTELGLSIGGMARLLEHLGDEAPASTIRRRVERWAQGATRIPGEAVALINVLRLAPAISAKLSREVHRGH